MELTSNSALYRRLGAYLVERFPPVAYTVLTGLFFGSAAYVALATGGGALRPHAVYGALIIWLVFLHLRIFDEHKDAEIDRVAHPDRLLSRGIVDLPLLRFVAILAIGIEGVVATLIAPTVLVAWVCTLAFTILMALEFGIGRWLRGRILIYAITHNPVVALLGVVAWSCTTAEFSTALALYLGAVSLGSLGFELGRKTHRPEEETVGVESYSSEFGRERAGWILRGTLVAAALLGLGCCWELSEVLIGNGPRYGGVLVIIGGIAGLSMSGPGESSKTVESGATLSLLCLMAGTWVAAAW